MRFKSDLIAPTIIAILLIVLTLYFPPSTFRTVVALPFMLFFPGYVLIAALFPQKEGLTSPQRVGWGFGLSIAVVGITGFILSYTPWMIRLEPILYTISSFVFISSIIAWIRRNRLPETEQFGVELAVKGSGWRRGTWDKALSIILLLSIVGTIATMGYSIANPKVGERFTEFYILSLSDNTIDYPRELVIGEQGRVKAGIINHEHEQVTYWGEVTVDDVRSSEVGPVTLEHEENWEGIVSFTSAKAGGKQKVEFLLYRTDQNEVYRRLHLWVDFIE